jgi:hypothetical protein
MPPVWVSSIVCAAIVIVFRTQASVPIGPG